MICARSAHLHTGQQPNQAASEGLIHDRTRSRDQTIEKLLAWRYTPKHGSWLDMAESELAVLATQRLDHRIPDKPTLIAEVAAWQDNRNKRCVKADWRFTTDARITLKTLCPQFQ